MKGWMKMELLVKLTNGEEIKINKNTVLVGYVYSGDRKSQKQRTEEFTLIMLTPSWHSLAEFFASAYCFEIRSDENYGKIYFSHSVNTIVVIE